jgi:hypothetical protein
MESRAVEQPIPGGPILIADPKRHQPARQGLASHAEHTGNPQHGEPDKGALLANHRAIGGQQVEPGGGEGGLGRRGIMRGHRGLLACGRFGLHLHPTPGLPDVNPSSPKGQT